MQYEQLHKLELNYVENPHLCTVWCMFYANLVAMDRHPGTHNRKDHQGIKVCAEIADRMLVEYLNRYSPQGLIDHF